MMRMARSAYESSQEKANQEKLELARTMVGKRVIIDGVPRKVTDYSELTGDLEIRIGLKTSRYDPRQLSVVD